MKTTGCSHRATTSWIRLLLLFIVLAALIMCDHQMEAAPASATNTDADEQNQSSNNAATTVTMVVNRTRLHKRSFETYYRRELSIQQPDWVNPCRGKWTLEDSGIVKPAERCKKRKMLLNKAQTIARGELKQLRAEGRKWSFERITNVSIWGLHKAQYNFLPQLPTNKTTLALGKWHKDLQFYVAAFSYLRHAQLHWDLNNLRREDEISKDLLVLRKAARSVLCGIESAINETNAMYHPTKKRTHLALRQIAPLPRDVIEGRIEHFHTNLVQLNEAAIDAAHNGHGSGDTTPPVLPSTVDMIFLKKYFLQYVNQIKRTLHRIRAKPCPKFKPRTRLLTHNNNKNNN